MKRLDDPAQRASAIKRLSEFFDDGMSKAKKNREDPAVKALLDTIVEPLTKTYTAGNLDEKTRKDSSSRSSPIPATLAPRPRSRRP